MMLNLMLSLLAFASLAILLIPELMDLVEEMQAFKKAGFPFHDQLLEMMGFTLRH